MFWLGLGFFLKKKEVTQYFSVKHKNINIQMNFISIAMKKIFKYEALFYRL